MPSPHGPNASADTGSPGRTPVKAAIASFMGSAVEYYDFFIFGSAAALIFPHIFFPDTDTNAAVMSLATFGFAYVARPVGAIFVGHFGDRIGRQKVLMFTLLLMGASTFLIGCLPTFEQVGWLAPILLVFARLCQGLSAAGEQAGASSMSLEHAPDHRRSFFTSWTLTGTQGGQILAAMIFIPVVALPDEIKFGIGWRIPFWLSAVVVIITFFIRRSLHETPEFEEAKKNNDIAKLPLAVLLRFHWKDVLRVVLCAFIAAVSTVYGTLAISYGKVIGNMDESITLWLVVAGNIGALISQPLFGMLADKIGRKPVFIYGALGSAAIMPFYLRSMESSNALLQFTLSVLVFSCAFGAANAVWPSFYAEMFSSQVRFSGLAIGTQLGFLMAGFAPSIVAALGGLEANGWVQISLFTAAIAVISSLSALTARETYRVPTKQLGHTIEKVAS